MIPQVGLPKISVTPHHTYDRSTSTTLINIFSHIVRRSTLDVRFCRPKSIPRAVRVKVRVELRVGL